MAKSIDDFKDIAKSLTERDADMHDAFVRYEEMFEGIWNEPEIFEDMDWLVKRVDPRPRNSIMAGIRAYSTLAPHVSLTRPNNNQATKERHNKIEAALQYEYARASKRRDRITDQIIHSALLYDQVVAQVIHIDAQTQLTGEIMPANRNRGIRQYGNYIVNIHNPRNVNVRWSDYGPEGVLSKRIQTVSEFLNFWKDKGKPIADRMMDERYQESKYICSWVYRDYEHHAMWATFLPTTQFPASVDGYKCFVEEHDMPFLNWVVEGDGSNPLLKTIDLTKEWEAKNVEDTLLHSEAVTRAAAPRYMIEGPNGDVEIVYGDPSRILHVPPGSKLTQLEPPILDQNLVLLSDRTETNITQSTAPLQVLSGQSFGGNVAFASVNQALESGLMTYAPARERAERAIEKIYCQFLYWARYLDKPIIARIPGEPEEPAEFEIDPQTLDYENIEATVDLIADMPVDKLQQVNTAAIAKRDLGWSSNRANEMLGITDPEVMEKETAQEVMRVQAVENRRMAMEAEGVLRAQALTAGLQDLLAIAEDPQGAQILAQIAQQLQAQAQQQAAPPGQGTPPNIGEPQGIEGVGGPGFDPAGGGQSGLNADPNATFEGQTQTDRSGRPLA